MVLTDDSTVVPLLHFRIWDLRHCLNPLQLSLVLFVDADCSPSSAASLRSISKI
jgi:hypothetical protein